MLHTFCMQRIRIATRKSPLALWQSQHVADCLRAIYPELVVELIPISTRGDSILDRPLAQIGGKALFLKELEQALIDKTADCAVHSLKDVPVDESSVFCLPAVLVRDDPSDAFVCPHFSDLNDLPPHSRVGTSSVRRQALLRALRSDLHIVNLRGNVNTRLAKLHDKQYEAIIVACAGLRRLDFAQHIAKQLPLANWPCAPGQGAIAVQCLQDASADLLGTLMKLEHAPTREAITAERAMSRALGGSCHAAVGAYAFRNANGLCLHGMVGHALEGVVLRAWDCVAYDPQCLGEMVAEQLMRSGALRLLR